MKIVGKKYDEGQLRMLLRAVRKFLNNDTNICRNHAALRDTAVHIGLVSDDECDLG